MNRASKNRKAEDVGRSLHPVVVPLRVSWFSAGVSSAVATKLCIGEIDRIIYTHIDNQEADTMRFIRDCEAWFGKPVEILQSPYKNVETAILQMRFINSPHGPACSRVLKRRVRQEWEMGQERPLVYYWGLDSSIRERKRAKNLPKSMPKQSHRFPLIEHSIDKEQAHQMLAAAGIKRPKMYDLGYHNNNCVGCPRGGAGYWNRIRVTHPDVFLAMAALERKIGATCMMKDDARLWLDELNPKAGRHAGPIVGECGIMCEIYAEAMVKEY